MALIAISDLRASRPLDRQAMKTIRGGAAPWVYGWIRPYSPDTPRLGPVVNLYQISNTIIADQVINQFQTVDVRNTGANAIINVNAVEHATNFGVGVPGPGGAVAG
jgi:hypothetical protein